MTTPNIMLQKTNVVNSKSGFLSSQSNSKNGTNFDMIMDSSLKSNKELTQNYSFVKDRKSSTIPKKQNGIKKDYTDKKTENKSTDKNNQTLIRTKSNNAVDKVTEETYIKSTSKLSITDKDDITADHPILAQIMGMLHGFKDEIASLLNISVDELEQIMIDQDNNLLDLVDVDTLKQFVLICNKETDITSFLTNENLTDQLNELINSMNRIFDESNLPMSKDEIKSLLNQLQNQDKDLTDFMMIQSKELIDPKAEIAKVSKLGAMEDEIKIAESAFGKVDIEVLKYTDVKSTQSSFSQTDSKNEKNSDLMASEQYNLFLDNLTGAAKDINVNFADNMLHVTEFREIADQIIERIKVIIKPDQTSMELQLNPEHLGKVNLSVQSKEGVLTANFLVQNEVAKEAIESQLHNLKETLGQQGIKVEAIEVTVATYDFGQNSQAGKEDQSQSKESNQKKILTLDEINSLDMDVVDVNDSSDLTGISGNQINYKA